MLLINLTLALLTILMSTTTLFIDIIDPQQFEGTHKDSD